MVRCAKSLRYAWYKPIELPKKNEKAAENKIGMIMKKKVFGSSSPWYKKKIKNMKSITSISSIHDAK